MFLRIEQTPPNSVLERTTQFPLDGGALSVGRTPDNDICLPDKEVSRRHALLRRQNDVWEIYDLGSSNGTFLNELKLVPHAARPITHGQRLRIGPFVLTVRQPDLGAIEIDSAETPPLHAPAIPHLPTMPVMPVPVESPAEALTPPAEINAEPAPLPEPSVSPTPATPAAASPNTDFRPMLRWILPALAIGLVMMVSAIVWRNQLTQAEVLTTDPQFIDGGTVDKSGFVPTALPPDTTLPDAERINLAPQGSLLPNASFEEAAIDQNGWEVPTGWTLVSMGGMESKPNVMLVSAETLSVADRQRLIVDGNYALNLYTNETPIMVRLFTTRRLEAGTYQLTVNVVPEIIDQFNADGVQYATDPAAAEVRLLMPTAPEWQPVAFGSPNNLGGQFTLNDSNTVLLGIELRAPIPHSYNGWFLDHFLLMRVE